MDTAALDTRVVPYRGTRARKHAPVGATRAGEISREFAIRARYVTYLSRVGYVTWNLEFPTVSAYRVFLHTR